MNAVFGDNDAHGSHGDHGGHGDHDHGHSHGDDDHCGHHSHSMTFHACVCAEILFSGWATTNAMQMFGSCVAIFFAGVLYEGLKYFREALYMRATTATRDSQVNITKTEGGSGTSGTVPLTMTSPGHLIQTALHLIQSTISYTLMLVFMTYNVYLCFALVFGLAVGYFFFGWRKSTVVDSTEHCQ